MQKNLRNAPPDTIKSVRFTLLFDALTNDFIRPGVEETTLLIAAFERVKQLEELKRSVAISDGDQTNVNAIIDTYKRGDLEVIPRRISLWWGGLNKTGSIEEYPSNLVDQLEIWKLEDPGGSLWTEKVCPI